LTTIRFPAIYAVLTHDVFLGFVCSYVQHTSARNS
jgi:hypothetical protein